MISRIIYEHACEPDKEGKMRVLSKVELLKPQEVCTDSYLVVGKYDTEAEAKNLQSYLKTKFVRFLIAQTLSSINLSKDKFIFVPAVDMTRQWTDDELFARFDLNTKEIDYIESFMHDMPATVI